MAITCKKVLIKHLAVKVKTQRGYQVSLIKELSTQSSEVVVADTILELAQEINLENQKNKDISLRLQPENHEFEIELYYLRGI